MAVLPPVFFFNLCKWGQSRATIAAQLVTQTNLTAQTPNLSSSVHRVRHSIRDASAAVHPPLCQMYFCPIQAAVPTRSGLTASPALLPSDPMSLPLQDATPFFVVGLSLALFRVVGSYLCFVRCMPH
eukprot:TRINITY_DN66826_c11_g1_i3.p1 TRINITY_DN66826_c11_g1~~TRINITY_DN66826_c11_g1_i3.p1  ORF type:complete len:127 (+),score=6.18 TRINITY_DN66826_c11_g1_i3:415-795(+)